MQLTLMKSVPARHGRWLRRAGIVGFWFFLVKGLLWLAAPVLIYYAL